MDPIFPFKYWGDLVFSRWLISRFVKLLPLKNFLRRYNSPTMVTALPFYVRVVGEIGWLGIRSIQNRDSKIIIKGETVSAFHSWICLPFCYKFTREKRNDRRGGA